MSVEISSFKRIVVLTGAGISAESGIATFRDSDGLWEKHRIEDVATPEAFERDPCLVWRFYSMRRLAAAAANPNPAHHALARLCASSGSGAPECSIITQNVDCLHERARSSLSEKASTPPLCMHGTLSRSRCTSCARVYVDPWAWFNESGEPICVENTPLRIDYNPAELINAAQTRRDRQRLPLSPCCDQPIRPHIVWFGERPLFMDEISQLIGDCDLFVTIGTSGLVYPAAGLIEEAKIAGARTVCLNKEPLPQRSMVDFYVEGPASQTVPAFFHALLT